MDGKHTLKLLNSSDFQLSPKPSKKDSIFLSNALICNVPFRNKIIIPTANPRFGIRSKYCFIIHLNSLRVIIFIRVWLLVWSIITRKAFIQHAVRPVANKLFNIHFYD